jgi:hypothetical protein
MLELLTKAEDHRTDTRNSTFKLAKPPSECEYTIALIYVSTVQHDLNRATPRVLLLASRTLFSTLPSPPTPTIHLRPESPYPPQFSFKTLTQSALPVCLPSVRGECTVMSGGGGEKIVDLISFCRSNDFGLTPVGRV